MDRHRAALIAAVVVPATFLALFFAYPLAAILERSLSGEDGLAGAWDVLTAASTAEIAWFTIWQAGVSTVLTFAFGLPLAWAVGRFAFPGRSLVRALVLVPFVLPTVVVAMAFVAFLPEGHERGLLPITPKGVFFFTDYGQCILNCIRSI